MTYYHFLPDKRNDIETLLKELASNEMLETMFSNLSTLSKICLSLPVGVASAKRSFCQVKVIETRLRSRLGERNLSSYEDCT